MLERGLLLKTLTKWTSPSLPELMYSRAAAMYGGAAALGADLHDPVVLARRLDHLAALPDVVAGGFST